MSNLSIIIQQVGSDVIMSGSGSVDLTSLTFDRNESIGTANITPNTATLLVADGSYDVYTQISGPLKFGNGTGGYADSSSGDSFGLEGQNVSKEVWVPSGYTSNSLLSGTSTYNNKTISGLGLSAGTYTWTFSGGTIDLNVVAPPTPTPTPTGTASVTPTPTQTNTGTAAITPTPSKTASVTPTPTPTASPVYPLSGLSADAQYEYTVGMLGNFSGGSINEGGPANGFAPHPIYTDGDGVPYAQLNAITLGGFNGLNN